VYRWSLIRVASRGDMTEAPTSRASHSPLPYLDAHKVTESRTIWGKDQSAGRNRWDRRKRKPNIVQVRERERRERETRRNQGCGELKRGEDRSEKSRMELEARPAVEASMAPIKTFRSWRTRRRQNDCIKARYLSMVVPAVFFLLGIWQRQFLGESRVRLIGLKEVSTLGSRVVNIWIRRGLR